MKFVLFTLGLFLFVTVAQAQIDAPRKSIEIKGEQPNEVPTSVLLSPEESNNFISSGTLTIKSKMNLIELEDVGKEKKQVRFMKGNDFAKKDMSALTKKLNEQYVIKDNPLSPEYYKDQNLGNFKSGTKFVNFKYRDHQYVDGDRVSVSINDTVIHPNITLSGSFEGFLIELDEGFNKIDIIALNTGASGPNTAQFIMYDDNKQVISSNVWNLATGVKATVIIIKE